MLGLLAGIIFVLKVFYELEKRIANIDLNIQKMVFKIDGEEQQILAEEKAIEKALGIAGASAAKSSSKKKTTKKTAAKKTAKKSTRKAKK